MSGAGIGSFSCGWQLPVLANVSYRVSMETAGACFERGPGQAPAEVLMLWQLEAATKRIVAQSAGISGRTLTASSCRSRLMGSNPNLKMRARTLDCDAPTLY